MRPEARIATLTPIAAIVLLIALAPAQASVVSEGVVVPSDGTTVTVALAHGSYRLRASGTYDCNTIQEGTCIADAQFAWTLNGPCDDQPDDNLGLMVNSGNPWPRVCQPTTHAYEDLWTCRGACALSFYVKDDRYVDNAGTLNVTISPCPSLLLC